MNNWKIIKCVSLLLPTWVFYIYTDSGELYRYIFVPIFFGYIDQCGLNVQ